MPINWSFFYIIYTFLFRYSNFVKHTFYLLWIPAIVLKKGCDVW